MIDATNVQRNPHRDSVPANPNRDSALANENGLHSVTGFFSSHEPTIRKRKREHVLQPDFLVPCAPPNLHALRPQNRPCRPEISELYL